jgi:hypothetical protein
MPRDQSTIDSTALEKARSSAEVRSHRHVMRFGRPSHPTARGKPDGTALSRLAAEAKLS